MPFIETALIHDDEMNFLHFAGYRARVIGAGVLKSTLYSTDNVDNVALANQTMSATTDREKVVLANFNQQRAKLRIYTDAIDEIFEISNLIVFVKKLWTADVG